MHLKFFGMSETPFPTVALSEHFYGFDSVQSGLNSLGNALDRAAGPCLVIGAAGTGKSMLLSVLAQNQQGRKLTLTLANSRLCTRRALLQSMLFELGIDYKNKDEGELRLTLTDFLKNSDTCPNGVLVLIDEAHTLPLHLLDELRVLTNLIRNGHAQIQLILAGNSNLEENFADPSMESFNQRVACRAYLSGIGRDELPGYIAFQLKRVHSSVEDIFTIPAMNSIHTATSGIPRLVNQLCDFTLVCAFEKKLHQVDENFVQWVWSILQQIPNAIEEPTSTAGSSNQPKPSGSIVEFGSLDDEPTNSASQTNPLLPKIEANRVEASPVEIQHDQLADCPTSVDAVTQLDHETLTSSSSSVDSGHSHSGHSHSGHSHSGHATGKTQTFGFSEPGFSEPGFSATSQPTASTSSEPSSVNSVAASTDREIDQSSESNKPATFITFAFEQNIQKPTNAEIPQEPTSAENLRDADQVELCLGDSADLNHTELKLAPESANHTPASSIRNTSNFDSGIPTVEIPAFSPQTIQQINAKLDTVAFALDSLENDWNTVEQVIAEADLHQSVRPMLDDHPQPAQTVKPVQSIRSIDQAFLFNDHLYDETEVVADTAWTRFIQAPAQEARKPSVMHNLRPLNVQTTQLPDTQTPIRIGLATRSSVDKGSEIGNDVPDRFDSGSTFKTEDISAVSSEGSHTYQITQSNQIAQSKINFGTGLQDDRSIIRAANEASVNPHQHEGHSAAAPTMARRKDLRALLTALRGY